MGYRWFGLIDLHTLTKFLLSRVLRAISLTMDSAPPNLADDGLEITAPPARPEAVIVAQLVAGGASASIGASACMRADTDMQQAIVAAGAIPPLVQLLKPGFYLYATAGLVSLPWNHVEHTPAIVADVIKRLLQALDPADVLFCHLPNYQLLQHGCGNAYTHSHTTPFRRKRAAAVEAAEDRGEPDTADTAAAAAAAAGPTDARRGLTWVRLNPC
jgi:hypothetical protein